MARLTRRGEEATVNETTQDVHDDEDVTDLDGHEVALEDLDEDPELLRPAPLAWRRRTAIEMVVSGLIGLYTSFVLSIEAITIAVGEATQTDVALGCDLNAVISCSTVGASPQAQLFGFPNAFLGIAAEAIVITVAIAMLGGVLFPRWFMLWAQVIYTAGLVFAWWLFQQSYFEIKALCPWCLLITVTTTLVWAGLTRINVRDGHLNLPGRWGPWGRRFVASGNDWFITAAVLVLFAAVVFAKYGWTLLV